MSREPVCEVSKKLLDLEQISVITFFVISFLFLTQVDKLLNAPRIRDTRKLHI
jgi:uncharacterized membrane protein